jgi:Holliday junction resolvase
VEVLDLLRSAGFRAERNSGAARPRQTDILAEGHGVTLLIEVKDRKRVVEVGDIDNLRARLGRTTHDVIGVIFTKSAISKLAVKEIETDRSREIIVFIQPEIELLRKLKWRVINLIAQKRRELRVNGRVWVQTDLGAEHLKVPLPRSTMRFLAADSSSGYFWSKTRFAHAAFAVQIPDTSWARKRRNQAVVFAALEHS